MCIYIYIYIYIFMFIFICIFTCACTYTFSPACPPPQESVEIALKSCTCFSICLIVGALISAAFPLKAKHTPSASGTPRSCWGSTKTASRPCTSDTIRIDYLPPGFTNHDLLCTMLCSGRLSLGMKLHSKNAVTATTALEFQVRHVRTPSC